jgi:Cu-Zn family superoxide dismutase
MRYEHCAMIVGMIAAGGTLACTVTENAPAAADAGRDVTAAVAVLHPTEGNDVHGIVLFEHTADGVQLTADVSGLAPGQHGFHIHALGDCSAPDGTSAGGHFNPEDMPHGGPLVAERHVGDMGNLGADSTRSAHYQRTDRLLTLNGPHSIIGRAVIVHAEPDDMRSQPTGAAGGRVACGVIGIAE